MRAARALVLRQVMQAGMSTTPQPSRQRLLLIAIVGCLAISGTCQNFHSTNRRVDHDPASQANLAAAKGETQPLLDALEKYRAATGLYPPTLDELVPAYLPSLRGIRVYRYSARAYDWVYKSDACADRRKTLEGWVVEEAKQYQKEVADFKRDCLTGFRCYRLQSHSFLVDAENPYTERWAYYDSSSRQWRLGWCSHSMSRGPTTGTNGVCPSTQRRYPDPW
jgi:hypothetical protein